MEFSLREVSGRMRRVCSDPRLIFLGYRVLIVQRRNEAHEKPLEGVFVIVHAVAELVDPPKLV